MAVSEGILRVLMILNSEVAVIFANGRGRDGSRNAYDDDISIDSLLKMTMLSFVPSVSTTKFTNPFPYANANDGNKFAHNC